MANVGARVSKKKADAIRAKAEAEGRTVSDTIRILLDDWLADEREIAVIVKRKGADTDNE